MTPMTHTLRPYGAIALALALALAGLAAHSHLPFLLVLALFVSAAIDLSRIDDSEETK